MKKNSKRKALAILVCLTAVYLIFIIVVKLLKPGYIHYASYMNGSAYSWDILWDIKSLTMHLPEALANVILLIPLSILSGLVIKNKYFYWCSGLILGIFLEVMQPVFGTGVSDTASVICLWTGWALGYIIEKRISIAAGK